RRPDPAGAVAVAVELRDQHLQIARRQTGAAEVAERDAQPVRHQRDADHDAQQGLDDGSERREERIKHDYPLSLRATRPTLAARATSGLESAEAHSAKAEAKQSRLTCTRSLVEIASDR